VGFPPTRARLPSVMNPATSLPWQPATEDLRNITGLVTTANGNRDGRGGHPSTVSGATDTGGRTPTSWSRHDTARRRRRRWAAVHDCTHARERVRRCSCNRLVPPGPR